MKDGEKNFRFYWEEPYEQEPRTAAPSIKIEMPGFKKDEIKATLTNNMITVSASKKAHQVQKGSSFYREEASASSFSKSMMLPGEIDQKQFEVVVKDGAVLLKRRRKIKEDA